MRSTKNLILLALAAAGLLALPGCNGVTSEGQPSNPFTGTGNGGTGDDDDDDDSVGTVQTALTGVVRDALGMPIMGATVEVGGQTVTTDQDGHFTMADLEAADRVSVNVTKEGFARNSTPIGIIEDTDNTVLVTLAELDYEASFDASAGHSFEIELGGPTVDLPADGFVDADGNAYTGTVTVSATFYDLESDFEDGNELNATPGDFTAIDGNGEYRRLESYGMFQVNLVDADGNELNLADGSAAPVVMPLQGVGYTVGETIPMWHYDEVEGRWMEEVSGTVVELEGGALAVEFDAPHFSTWNCDRPISTHGCVSGQLNTATGQNRGGATIRAVGISYISTTTARSNANGEFCLEVKNGETIWLEISYAVNGVMATQRTEPVTIPSGQGTCDGLQYSGNGSSGNGQNCVELGEINLDIVSCLSGVVINSQGQGVAGAIVAASGGGQAETDSQGMFCITTPVFQTNTVSVVEGQIGTMEGFRPMQVYTQPGMPECQGGCPNVVVLQPYSGESCANGELWLNNAPGANQVIEVFDANFPESRIFATVVEQSGEFCVPVPTGVDVIVQSSAGPNGFCDAVELSAIQGGGGSQCDGTGQGGECIDVGVLSCTVQ